MSRKFCFTVDLDRDVNMAVPGQVAAGSLDRGEGTGPRFGSTDRGLLLLSELLDDIGMSATFFAEGKTLETISNAHYLAGHEVGVHGYEHEDLTGESNGVRYEIGEKEERIRKASEVVRDVVGKDPVCFRAPYMSVGKDVLDILPGLGLKYDSSSYVPMSGSLMPYRLDNGLIEIPVPEGKDRNGKKVSAYLWPMHEGKRIPKDYIELASHMDDGIFVLADHTWHMSESRSNGMMDKDTESKNIDNTRAVLEGIIDLGFVPETIPNAVSRLIE